MKSEIIFEVTEAEEGGYCAAALGYGINTQGETNEVLRSMVRDAVDCYFDNPSRAPRIIRLQSEHSKAFCAPWSPTIA